MKALSYSRVTVDIEAIAGPAVAGLLVAVFGLRWVFWFDAATYFVSALLISSVRVPSPGLRTGSLPGLSLLRDLSHGARVLLRNRSIRQALVMALAEALAGACAIVVTVVYVRDLLRGSELDYSLIMAAAGAGSALTAFLLSRITARIEGAEQDAAGAHTMRHLWVERAVVLGGALLALCLGAASAHPGLLVFGALWLLNGTGQALIAIPSSTLVASHTRPEERGRAFAAHFAITHACWLVAYPLSGRLAERFGPADTFLWSGIACAVITVVAVAMARGSVAKHDHPQGV